jgi:hypothetical protein
MLEKHAKEWNPGLDREAATGLHLGKEHWNGIALGRGESPLAANCKRTFKSGLLRVRVPGVPALDVRVDAKDRFRRRADCDAVFDLHLKLRAGAKLILCGLTFELSRARR